MKEIYFKIGDKTCKAIAKVRLSGENMAIDFHIDCKLQMLNFAVVNNLDFYATDSICTIAIPIEYILTVKNTDSDEESLTC